MAGITFSGVPALTPLTESNMTFFPDFFSLPIDWCTLFYGAGVGAAGLASVFTHEHSAGEVDVDTVKKRIAELEKLSARSLEQNDELARLYSANAIALWDEGADLTEIVALFVKAEVVLMATLAQGDDVEVRRQLGNVYLNCAVALNDYDELTSSVDYYLKGIDTLKPLDNSGDAEAKYDIAGMRLNLGNVYHELGEFEKAKTSLDESFLDFRAVEKIGVADTRLFMAKVSVQQGHLLSDMGEAVGSIVDAHNRAMRLFIEVIEDQNLPELERDLAGALLARCEALYTDCHEREFASEEERNTKIAEIQIDIAQGVELLEKQYKSGNDLARLDLFHGLVFQGKVLCDIEQYVEAKEVLDRAINEFSDLCDGEGDDLFLMQMAVAYASRAVVQMGLGKPDLSKQDCMKGSELVNKLLQEDSDDEDMQALREQFQAMLE